MFYITKRDFNPFSGLKVIKQGDKVSIAHNSFMDKWYITYVESTGHLQGWGIEITKTDVDNYFTKEVK